MKRIIIILIAIVFTSCTDIVITDNPVGRKPYVVETIERYSDSYSLYELNSGKGYEGVYDQIDIVEKHGAFNIGDTIYLKAYKSKETRYNEFLKMVDHLSQMSSLDNAPHIIVRPHYAEDFGAWHDALNGMKNITVINEGSISAWLLASEGLLHSGCTTAFEARLMNIKTAYFMDTAQSAIDAYPIKISECLKNMNDYLKWTNKTVNQEDYSIDKYVVNISSISSAKKILNNIELKKINSEPSPNKPRISFYIKIGRLMPGFFKDFYSRLRFIIKNPRLRPLANYNQKMDGGITLEECKIFMNKLDFNLKNVSFNKLEKDLIVIEKSR